MKKITFSKLVGDIFQDVKSLYKNFIHWNISKLIIAGVGLILGVLFGIGFVLLALILMYFDPIEWKNFFINASQNTVDPMMLNSVLENFLFALVELILMVVGVFTFFIGWYYAVALQLFLYKNYLDGKKLGYKKNYYFDTQRIKRFFHILLWATYYISLPLLFGGICFIILLVGSIAFFGDIQKFGQYIMLNDFNFFTLSMFLIFVITLFFFIYVNYRVYFANMLFIDDFSSKNFHHPKTYIEKSISLTKGYKNLFRFIGILCIYGIVISVLTLPAQNVDKKISEITIYAQNYQSSGSLDIETQEIVDAYSIYSDEQIWKQYNTYNVIAILLTIFYYFTLTGVMEMVVYSFYRSVIKK